MLGASTGAACCVEYGEGQLAGPCFTMINSASSEMEAPLGGTADRQCVAAQATRERCVCSGLLTSGGNTLSLVAVGGGTGSQELSDALLSSGRQSGRPRPDRRR